MDTLSEVLIALLKNSVDAHSTSIAIRVCPDLFWLQVLDNGDGFEESDLASVGKCCLLNIDFQQMRQTKKFARLTGSSLLDIIGRCEEVLIESLDCRRPDPKSLSRTFKHPAAANDVRSSSQDNVTTQYGQQGTRKTQGTTVTLKNLFWQDPDRQRQQAADYGTMLVELRKFALVHYDRSFTLHNLSTDEVEFKSKKAPTFIAKYCELYQHSAQDIDVTTCTKDNVCIECYFSQRRAVYPVIQFTFINGLPSEAFLPTVSDILTQEKESLNFVLVASYPKHDVLTQLTEPLVRNCLLRCLSQYKKLLKDRKVASAAIVSPEQIPRVAAEDYKPDQEDILYGLRSQPQQYDAEENQKAIEKCSLWLRNNDFDVLPERGPNPQPTAANLDGKRRPREAGQQQPVDFFGTPLAQLDNQAKFAAAVPSTPPRNKLPAKLPVPKFLSRSPITAAMVSPKKHRRKPPKKTAPGTPQKHWKIVEIKQKQVEDVAVAPLEPDEPKNHRNQPNKHTAKPPPAKVEIPTVILAAPAIIKYRFDRGKEREQHSINNYSPTMTIRGDNKRPNPKISGDISFMRDFERTDVATVVSQKADSFLNIWPGESAGGDIHAKRNETTTVVFEGGSNIGESRSKGIPRSILNNQSAMESEIPPYVFPDLKFLAPRVIVESPPSLWEGRLDLPERFEDFHEAYHETTRHYRIAVTDNHQKPEAEEGCRCRHSPASREIEILRQPFLEPRNILGRPQLTTHRR